MKRLSASVYAPFCGAILMLLSGCETPQQNALLGAALGGLSPYGKTLQAQESLAAMGNAASGYANAQASQPQVTVINSASPQPQQQYQPQQVPSGPNVGDTRHTTEELMTDGSKYTGLVKLHQDNRWYAEGRGRMTWPNGNKYEGEFSNGLQNGQGIVTWSNGDKYEGEVRDGKKNGHGKYTWLNGEKYEGEYRDDRPNGQGIYTFPTGEKYEGEWRDGKKNGQGTGTFKNGAVYVGEWNNDQLDGSGVWTQPYGVRIEGTWRDGKRYQVAGKEVFQDGTVEVGSWNSDGNKCGGTITWKDGREYTGDWKIVKGAPELPDGTGRMTWPDGHKYIGEFTDGKRGGQGTDTSANGIVLSGIWQDDKFVGGIQASATPVSTSRQNTTPANSRLGTLNITSDTPDCEVYVDGKFVGGSPAKLKLAEGSHKVEVKKSGYKDYEKQLEVTDGSELTLHPVLEKQ